MEFLFLTDTHAEEYNKFATVDPKTGMNSRLAWVIDVFNQAREYALENEIPVIFIGGDIFDKRGTISVPVYDAVYRAILEMKEDGIAVFSIVGNHDQALRSGEIHALSPLPMHVIDSHGALAAYGYPGVVGISFCETPQEFLKKLEQTASKKNKFYFIHQGVNGAKIAGDEILSKDEADLADIRRIVGEDAWIFSGHYHIHQKLDDRFWYGGSAVPKDFGDKTPKGFLHFKEGEIKQIESRAPRFLVIDEKEVQTRAKEIKGNYVQIQYSGREPEGIEKLKPAGYVATKKKVEREYSQRSSITPEQSPLSIIRSYLRDVRTKFEEGDLIEALNEIVEGRKLENSFGGHKIELMEVSFKNFMSYDEGTVDLSDLKGLISIEGENKDDPSATSNGAGKSLIPEAIKWCLFGTTARGVSGDEVVNKKVGKDCRVELIVALDENDFFKIIRYRKHKEYKNQLFFWRMNELNGHLDDLRMESDSGTQEKFLKIFGIDENTFDNTVFFGHNFTKSFASLTDKEQKAVLETILGVEYFVELYEKAKSLGKVVQESYHQAEISLSYLQTRVTEAQEELTRVQTDAELFEENQAKKIKDQKAILKEREDFLKTVGGTEEEEAELAQVLTEQTKLAPQIEMYTELNDKLTELEEQEKNLEKEINALEKDKISKESALELSKSKQESLVDRLEEIDESIKKNLCPTCKQKISSGTHVAEKKNSLLEEMQVLQEREKELEGTRVEICTELGSKRKCKIGVEKEIVYAKKAVELAWGKVTRVEELEERRDCLTKEIQEIKRSMASATQQVQQAKDWIKKFKEEKNPLKEVAERQAEKLEGLKAEIEEKEELKETEFKKFEIYKFWENAFSDKGTPSQSPIKSFLFDSIVPVLDELARIYSEVLTSGSIEVQFNTVSALKSGELRDKFSVNVLNRFGASGYLGDSGGERRKVDLIIMFALHSLARIRSGSQVNCLFLDEILDSLDVEGCERVMSLLHDMQDEIEKIFVITHNENLKSRFGSKILVRKENGISGIVNLKETV